MTVAEWTGPSGSDGGQSSALAAHRDARTHHPQDHGSVQRRDQVPTAPGFRAQLGCHHRRRGRLRGGQGSFAQLRRGICKL